MVATLKALDAVPPRAILYEILNPPAHEGKNAGVVFFLNVFFELDKTAAELNRADYDAKLSRTRDIAQWHYPNSLNICHGVLLRTLIQ